ncbi:NEAT domain-containing protein [Eupransor demetentiae]|uniref:Heme-binding NEAT domain (NEAT) n=1 Tax=Eupransor demetentiae TaxID=3109584 RepID=A0ABP0EQF6_9LACO|nr:Heme-binding NEAT domain (NEAT) [Lactobacillaceae bacterium LMG 33000]
MNFKKILTVAAVVIASGMAGIFHSASADDSFSLNYTALKNGTNDTSMADQFSVKPGSARIVGDHYQVTLSIETPAEYGLFPVNILQVNGQTPSLSRSTSDGKSVITYTFNTNNLTDRIVGHMTVNIPAFRYSGDYLYDIVFDATGAPTIDGGKVSEDQAQEGAKAAQAAEQAQNENAQAGGAGAAGKAASNKNRPKAQVTPKAAIKHDKKDKAAGKSLPWWPFAIAVAVAVLVGIFTEWRSRRAGAKKED